MKPTTASSPEFRSTALRAGMDALGLRTPDEAVPLLITYLDLLVKWNAVYNLSAVRDPQQMLQLHLLDCLAVVPPLDRQLQGCESRILDVGSGAGLPGVVLAIMRPDWSVCCVDAVAKKASFVRQVALELSLKNLRAEHTRVEHLRQQQFDVVSSRAFASLSSLVLLTRGQLAPGGCWMAMKGHRPDEEIAALPGDVSVFHVEQLLVPGLKAERCLVWLRPTRAPGRLVDCDTHSGAPGTDSNIG